MEQYKDHYNDYKELLKIAGAFHGDVCAGIEIGTRMTMCGLNHIGITDPTGVDRKKLIVYVEVDRCATDAIMALTGCRPGKRTMKICDYGKMAATFINLDSGRAVRVATAMKNPSGADKLPDFTNISDEELFSIRDVEVALRPEDLPGKPLRRVSCARCGESIMDGRDVEHHGETLCRSCLNGNDYYRALSLETC